MPHGQTPPASSAGRGGGDGLYAPAGFSMLAQRLRDQQDARFFCGMGVCLECEVASAGGVVRLCLERCAP